MLVALGACSFVEEEPSFFFRSSISSLFSYTASSPLRMMSAISAVLKLSMLKPVRSGRIMTSDLRTFPT